MPPKVIGGSETQSCSLLQLPCHQCYLQVSRALNVSVVEARVVRHRKDTRDELTERGVTFPSQLVNTMLQ